MFHDGDINEDNMSYHDIRLYQVRNPVLFLKSMGVVAIGMVILYFKFRLSNCQCA